MQHEQQIVLVTGASSGIGKAVAAEFAKSGDIVYGTSRHGDFQAAGEEGARYEMIPLTLEDEESVAAAVDYVLGRHGRIDVLVNAAGSGIAGAIEETTAEEAKVQFEVCYFGVIRVLNHVLPAMRAAGGGMVVNIGSMAACFPIAFQGMYSAVKSALFMLTTTLRMEAKPFGIRACTVEPGDTKTGFTEKRAFTKQSRSSAYARQMERALYEMIRSELAAPGPELCAKTVLKVARMKNPPARVSVGMSYKTLYLLAKLTSWRFKERILHMMYLSKDPPKDAVWTLEKQFKE